MIRCSDVATFLCRSGNLEAWVVFDLSAEVYEIYTDEDGVGYIGCADTVAEARKVAKEWFQEFQSY